MLQRGEPEAAQETGFGYIVTQTPAPQRCPIPHWGSLVQVQKPSLHCPLGPHWALVTHVPHVPETQAMPPPHWLLACARTNSTDARESRRLL
jgi:hypothetical protein